MIEKNYTFLTMNDFSKEGGGTIRMYSIVNALAIKGHKVTLFSNAKNLRKFHENINHIPVDYKFTPKDKRKFQFLLSKFSYKVVNIFFSKLKNHFTSLLTNYHDKTIYTFEYLDNSIGYWLKKNSLIKAYVNDIHGVSTLEFDFQIRNNKNALKKLILSLKKNSAYNLDRKVLTSSSKNIFVTESMRKYFINLYPQLEKHEYTLLNNLVPPTATENQLRKEDATELINEYNIPRNHRVILFSGAFKLTGGMIELIKAFEIIQQHQNDITLLMVGDGYERPNCEQYVQDHQIKNIIFTGRTPYDKLKYFQALSDIIVCPDTNNEFSKLVIHIKYIDALLSNRIVINGNHPSVMEINKGERLSLTFEPSNIQNLADTIEYALNNYENLKMKYKPVSSVMLKEFSYIEKVEKI
ncbi:MAG: glycosyltransferase [Weeksellaceae bacterium]